MFQTRTLTRYVAAVLIVLAAVTAIRWLIVGYRGARGAETMLVFSGGFLCGMIAMYIAMHVYRDNIWPWLSSK
ncbi:MAG: hypothetical protein ACLPPF_06885 [Rhodomicrobium sp.]